jgi:membrane protease YdiL (CAAX protease family)
VRAFQLAAVFRGRIDCGRALPGGGIAWSYAFLGQEALAVAGQLAIALLAWRFVRLSRPFSIDRPSALFMAKVAGALAALFALAAALGYLIAGEATRVRFLAGLSVPLLTHPVGRVLAIGGFLFTAPLAEELVFRGLVYRALRKRFSAPVAAVLQAFLFAACHLETGLPPLLIAIPYVWGIAAAAIFERTRSLGAAVLLHSLGNAAGLVAAAFSMGI